MVGDLVLKVGRSMNEVGINQIENLLWSTRESFISGGKSCTAGELSETDRVVFTLSTFVSPCSRLF